MGKVGAAGDDEAKGRRESLASMMQAADDCTFQRLVEEEGPDVDRCRQILTKAPGKRTLDDVHTLKSLFAASKLLEFFSNLDAFKLERLYQALECKVFTEKGTFVFHQGDPGDSFYLVFTGQVAVVQENPDVSEKPIQLTTLGTGDTFGERALLYDSDVRAASVMVSIAPTEVVFVNRTVFTDLLNESHNSAASALEFAKRFRSNKDIVRNIFLRNPAQRSEKDLKFAVEYLKGVKFFSRFSFEVRKQLCKVMRLISAMTNTVLFEEGQVGRHFYIIFTGVVEVSVQVKNRFEEATDSVLSRLGEGDYFGELALSEADGVRRATVKCVDSCELLVLGRDQYGPLIKKYQNEYHAQYAQMLRKNPYFMGPEWDDNTIEGMCSVMTEKYIPFHGEICKQGSRAAELFIVTRGECRIVHEGKHPLTNEPQLYELGRFGPGSVLGCAEASAGKFTDIVVRDYSIYAESPMKILVLSRFDIFHLMSAEARDSLQRSALGNVRESIEARALKSMAWESYKKRFFDELTQVPHVSSPGKGRSSPKRLEPSALAKSISAPVLPISSSPARSLIDPGVLMLVSRQDLNPDHIGLGSPVSPSKKRGAPKRISERPLSSSGQKTDTPAARGDPADDDDAADKILHPDGNEARVDSANPGLMRSSSASALNAIAEKSHTPSEDTQNSDHNSQSRRQSLTRSASLSGHNKLTKRQSTPEITPPLIKAELPAVTVPSSKVLAPPGIRVSQRHLTRQRPDKFDIAGNSKGSTLALSGGMPASIWDPVHGVCQPFAVVGFMKEAVVKRRKSSVLDPRPASKGGKDTVPSSLTASTSGTANPEITRFRVLGKLRDVSDALDLFRCVCAVETSVVSREGADRSRFAIYKESEMTMVLENFPSESSSDCDATTRQFGSSDLPTPNGQRFACVGVLTAADAGAAPLSSVESVVVHVYQCFPTPPSAVRFARQMSSALLSVGPMLVVPLFEWVPLAELERFDARNADLEQALEQLALHHSRGTYTSTWKARKDAVKRSGAHHLKPGAVHVS